jgi:flagellar hook assembly protein FlgD
MALNKKFFPKVSAGAAADTFTPSEHFNTVLYTGNGSSQRIGGYINKGALFNGSSSVIKLTSGDGINVANANSVSFWFYVNDSLTTYDSLYSNIVLGGELVGQMAISVYNGIRLYGIRTNGSTSTTNIQYNATLSLDTWHHLVVVMSGGSDTPSAVYIDGTALTASSQANTAITSQYAYPYIGGASNAAKTNYLDGKIDQVRIFNKALSSSEVTTLYGETHSSTTISTKDIFDDDSGVALYQLDGNANATDDSGDLTHWAVVSDAGGNNMSCRLNSISSEFTYTAPTGYSDWGGAWDTTSEVNTGGGSFTYSESNKKINEAGGFYSAAKTENGYKTGKYYFEVEYLSADLVVGLTRETTLSSPFTDNAFKENAILRYTWTTTLSAYSTSNQSVGTAASVNDVYGFAVNFTDEEVSIYKNNTLVTTQNLLPNYLNGTASNVVYQEATKFSPDLVWIQNRSSSGGYFNAVMDTIRGATAIISTNSSSGEITSYTQELTSFDSNGFALGTGGGNYVNRSGDDYVAWCFNAGSGSSGSNTNGSIASTVKANTEAGFSIVQWEGDNSQPATIGHGLTAAPELIIHKDLDSTTNWHVYAESVMNAGDGKFLRLNTNNSILTDGLDDVWTSGFSATTFGVGRANNNTGRTQIAYCFHSVDGYQKIGTYDGSGASGNMVETGFEPAFVMIKRTDSSANWRILDNKRSTSNPRDKELYPNLSNAEGDYDAIDFLSNGFQNISTDPSYNASGGTYIYLAIAADPDTTTPTVADSFDVVAYTGNGSTQDIEVDFKPDLVWIKQRTGSAAHHLIFDSVRGAYKTIFPSSTSSTVDRTSVDKGVTSFDSNGFTVKDTSAGDYEINGSNGGTYSGDGTYIAWVWKAADHDESLPQINTEGTIDSIVSVNDAAGFSIVKYDGTGTAGSYGHGLSSAPEMIITKNIDWSTPDWFVYHKDLGTNGYLRLSKTTAEQTASTLWSSAPSATVVNIGNDSGINRSNGDTQIAYCWYSVTGYSKIGSYSGNQTLNTPNQINFGFTPRFVMIKNSTNSGSQWMIFDSTRTNGYALYANSSTNEVNYTTDLLLSSQGLEFKSTNINVNQSGATYIYLAIA